jgi:hypothetical protein
VPAAAAAAAAGTVHVSPQGNDGNDGVSWATAKLTVSGALAALPAGGIVFLAAGTFTEAGLAVPTGNHLRQHLGKGQAHQDRQLCDLDRDIRAGGLQLRQLVP